MIISFGDYRARKGAGMPKNPPDDLIWPSGPEVNLWAKQKRLYPLVIARLEDARGPNRLLDIDIAIVLGKVEDLAMRGSEEPRCRDGMPVPRFTESLQDVEVVLRQDFPRAEWTVQEVPHVEAEITEVDPDAPDEEPEVLGWAWQSPYGGTCMKRPPANMAIALTLAMLRASEEMYG